MAHVLTDEAFALAATHFHRLGRVDVPGYWIGAVLGVFIPWNLATLAGVLLGGAILDPTAFGLDVVFPAAMAGLAVGLVTGRREIVAAGRRRGDRRRCSRCSSGRASGSSPAACSGPLVGMAMPAGESHVAPDSDLTGMRVDLDEAMAEVAERAGRGETRAAGRGGAVSTELVLLALLMAAVTYPSRALPLLAPGHRAAAAPGPPLPAARRAGRAGLASPRPRRSSGRTTPGRVRSSGPGVGRGARCASPWWRGAGTCFLGLVAGVAFVALARLVSVG